MNSKPPYLGATVLFRERECVYVALVTALRGGPHDIVDLVVFNVGDKKLPDLNTNGAKERLCVREHIDRGEPGDLVLDEVWYWPDVPPGVWV